MKVTREINNFLVVLRDSGAVNMFGAAPYLQERFGLDRREAKDTLLAWMGGDRHEFIDAPEVPGTDDDDIEDAEIEDAEIDVLAAWMEDDDRDLTTIPTTYSGEHLYER